MERGARSPYSLGFAALLAGCGARSSLSVEHDGTTSRQPGLPCDPGSPGATGPAPLTDATFSPADIAVDSNYVWAADWYFGGAVGRSPLSGGAAQVLAENRPNPVAIVPHEGGAFWIDTGLNCGAGTLSHVSANGHVRRLAASLERPTDVEVDARYVYVSDGPQGPCDARPRILRFDHDGGGPHGARDG